MNSEEIVEVVMRKKMTYGEYRQMINQARSKGWHVQGYQVGVLSESQNKPV